MSDSSSSSSEYGNVNNKDPKVKQPVIQDFKKAYDVFLKSFAIAFGLRYGVSTILRCVQILRRRDFWALLSLNQLFSEKYMIARESAVRVGLAAGSFGAVYNLISSLIQRYDESKKGLGNFIAGLIGGFALLFLEKDSRRTVSLYLLGRVAECVYNSLKSRGMWHFWGSHWSHGDVLLFCLASAQVMYAYVMRPETIDKDYYNFIVRSGPIAEIILQQVRHNNRGRPIELDKVIDYVKSRNPNAPILSEEWMKTNIIPCELLHPQNPSCSYNAFDVLRLSYKKILPLYATLTFVPLIFMKFGSFIKNPFKKLLIGVLSTLQSSLFLSSFVAIYMSVICIQRKLVKTDFRFVYWLAGFFASTSLLFEKKARRAELALYALPRGLDSLYMLLLDRKWMASVPQGELLLFCLSMGSIMYFYDNESHTMSPFLHNILDWVTGRKHQKPPPNPSDMQDKHTNLV